MDLEEILKTCKISSVSTSPSSKNNMGISEEEIIEKLNGAEESTEVKKLYLQDMVGIWEKPIISI